MASIKGLLALFFNGAPPPPPVFVQYVASAPYLDWTTSAPASLWVADGVELNWSGSPVSGG